MAAPPPSKPDRRISRIRLSSRWVLCRGGTALRLVPKSVGQTFGITQANSTRLIPPPVSPRGHSRWFAFPSFCPSHFHLPASLCSTVVTRFFATTDALTPAGRFFGHCCHELRLAPAGLPDFGTGTADHSVSNHRCHDRGPPGCPAIRLTPIARFAGFVFRSKTRPSTPTESSSRRLSFGTTCVTDWSFSFRCSPPRIAATQLRFDTARLFTAQKRTSTALSHCPLRRTSAAFRLPTHGITLRPRQGSPHASRFCRLKAALLGGCSDCVAWWQ
jgi:hypothetical protein